MKRLIILLFLIGFQNINAQIHEIGGFLGGSNFIGDVGATTYIKPKDFAFGMLYKWNRSPRHAWRASYTQSKITAQDAVSQLPSREKRNFSFENNIKELSAGLEFNFFDFNLHDFEYKFTPYVYTGLSYLRYESLYYQNGEIYPKANKTSGAIAIPMVIGIKSKFLNSWVIGLEAGVRYSFSDNLDGSNPNNLGTTIRPFGNPNSNDWYVFSGLTLTYTFGEKPCYCKE